MDKAQQSTVEIEMCRPQVPNIYSAFISTHQIFDLREKNAKVN